jgi:D-glycerate 3-kinase
MAMELTKISALAELEGIHDDGFVKALALVAREITLRNVRTVGISGSQGSGKSTFARLLSALLMAESDRKNTTLSLDDFYKTRAERIELAETVHPLFYTRGVPGTHDAGLMLDAKNRLLQGAVVATPVFDKGSDERRKQTRQVGPVQLVILEGWCFSAVAQDEAALQLPVNELERLQDPEAVWRTAVNRKLAESDYQALFDVELSVFFKAPDMASIIRWRLEQELRFNQGARSMTEQQIRGFVQYYQRLTDWMLQDRSAKSDIVIALDQNHSVSSVNLIN